jgi:lysozyme
MLSCSDKGYAVNRAFEGRSLKAYRDEVGVWTIGYGNTNYDASVLGFTIKAGVTITATQAEDLLKAAMTRRYEPAVRKAMGPDCTQPAFDAGCSFHYNTGAIARASWVKQYVAKAMPAVHSGIMQWNKAGGKALAGLTRRRNREWEMISAGNYGPEGRQTVVTDEKGHAIAGATAPTEHVSPTAVAEATVREHGAYPGIMMLGDAGPEVVDEQKRLIDAGYKLPASGKYDAATVAAVTDFQRRHPQLRADGRIGPATRTALKRDAALKASVKSTAGKGAGTGAATIAVDSVTGGHLPAWALAAFAVVIVGALCYTAWKYRDELRSMFTAKKVAPVPAT